jgi:hypothetical protein
MPQIQHDLPIRRQMEPVVRDGRPQGVAAQPLEPRSIPHRDDDTGVQVEAVAPRVARSEALRRQ